MNWRRVLRSALLTGTAAACVVACIGVPLILRAAQPEGPHGEGTKCAYFDDSNDDARRFWDSCIGVTPCSGWCNVVGNAANGSYCVDCSPEQSNCYCSGTATTAYISDGACTADGGPNACYCRYTYDTVPITIYNCD
jgi:hypothetical protein